MKSNEFNKKIIKRGQEYPDDFKELCSVWIDKLLKTKHFEDYKLNYLSFKMHDEITGPSGKPTGMDIDANEAYLTMDISIYPTAYSVYKEHGKRYFVENYIPHELSHTITNPLVDLASERCITWEQLSIETEKLTEKVARLIVNNLNNNNFFDSLGKHKKKLFIDEDNFYN